MPFPDVRSALRTARWTLLARDRAIGRRLARARVARTHVRFSGARRFEVPELGLSFAREGHLFICESLPWLRGLRASAGAVVRIDPADGLVHISVGGIEAIVETEEDIFILHEIFVERAYACAITRPSVVWDVGCNVGFAALHFAQVPAVIHVEAFEPFRPTVAQARRNVAINPTLAAKITIHPYGVAAAARTDTLDYSYTWKGHAGAGGTLGHVVRDGRLTTDDIARESIALRGACEVLDAVVAAHPGVNVFAKIDCEGAEYEIVDALAAAGRLRDVGTFVIEWHTHGAKRLARPLEAAGFDVTATSDPSGLAGLVRAVCRS